MYLKKNAQGLKHLFLPIKFFTVNTKLEEMVVMASKDLTPAQKVTSSLRLLDRYIAMLYWFLVYHLSAKGAARKISLKIPYLAHTSLA